LISVVASGILLASLARPASAETVSQALASAYSSNPEINSARAATRATDENVPIALAGRRPVISAFSTLTGDTTNRPPLSTLQYSTLTGAYGLQVTQNLFTGFRVRNSILQSEAGVLASREGLRNTVQNVLFDAAQAYMDVVQNIAILDIRQSNVLFLEEQVRASEERFNVGENTRTDVAQTRASLAQGRAGVSLAESNLATSRATYRQIIGHDPKRLNGGFPYGKLVPRALPQAIILGEGGHPIVLAAIHQADSQAFVVKQIEGELLPSVTLEGTAQQAYEWDIHESQSEATITGRLTIPIYQGGSVGARVRQAKETYGQLKVEIDLARDQVRAAVATAWAQVDAARQAIVAAREGVQAAEIALTGVQEEQKVGQRTQLDVLDAQQTLLNAQQTLIVAEHDQVVASFALLSAMGRLEAEDLHLATPVYDPTAHYQAVRNKLYGTRTPDGR
jgi:outer membrane protein